MPAPTPSRHNRTFSPPTIVTPSRSNNRSASNYSNYTPTITSGGASGKMNIVTRVALEGRAKHGDDGASIKMYLKIAIPVDSVSPSASIPLFPEENVKILSSQVHPLDSNSVPYNFSSTLSPLLHRAASALNLPTRSQETFHSAFDIASTHSNASSSSRASKFDNPEAIPPVDPQYTGQILVSGYNISYVLPKYFPQQSADREESYSRASSRSRRPSISERNTAQFMVAIDMWVPYVTKPAKYPYLLSIPTPRCLHNHIKLRIFTPSNNTSNSYASLSSVEDDSSSWDLTSDPHVTRSTTRLARSNSLTHFADDESSDSSAAGFAEGSGIQGTFPSAERIRIRWARPSRSANVPGGGRDGRRRVGVKTSKGDMVCSIKGKVPGTEPGAPEGVLMHVKYTGSCSGVWFPGVATLLGMDVSLEAKGCDVFWPEGGLTEWKVTGGAAYTGLDVGASTNVPTQPNSRGSSFESNSANEDLTSSNGSAHGFLAPPNARMNSGLSTASLLRAPLPAVPANEYSFEGSTSSQPNGLNTSPLGTLSSIGSISGSMSINQSSAPQLPGVPITLHLNINELLPPAKNVFNFTVQGTIVLFPRHSIARVGQSQSRSSSPLEGYTDTAGLVMLPKFTVLASESETTTTTVRNEMESSHGAVDVYDATKDYRDAQAKKTVLQKGGYTKCGNEGARIAVKDHDPYKRAEYASGPSARPTTPLAGARPATSMALTTRSSSAVATINGVAISVVTATILPFSENNSTEPGAYNVSMRLNVPVVKDSDYLEFGFAHAEAAGDGKDKEKESRPPKLQLLSATVDGLPVEVDSSVSTEGDLSKYGVGFENLGGTEWVSWVRLRVGMLHGSEVAVEYLVKESVEEKSAKGKGRAGDQINVLLPTFSLPVTKYDVTVSQVRDFELVDTTSNFPYSQTIAGGHRLMQCSVDGFFYPQLSLTFVKRGNPSSGSRTTIYFVLTWILLAFTCLTAIRTLSRIQDLNSLSIPQPIPPPQEAELDFSVASFTVTSTIYETITIQSTATTTATIHRDEPRETPSPPSSAISTRSTPTTPAISQRPVTTSTSTATFPTTTIIRKPRPTQTLATSKPTTSTSTTPNPQATGGGLSLQPFRDALPFGWPDDLDLSGVKEVYQQVGKVAAVLWRILRTAYHYPLEVPE